MDPGRGLSAELPFKTIQACVNYVTNTYNINIYIATIYISSGTYAENIRLGTYQASTGYCMLRGQTPADPPLITSRSQTIRCSYALWHLLAIKVQVKWTGATVSSAQYPFAISVTNSGNLTVRNIQVEGIADGETTGGAVYMRIVTSSSNGTFSMNVDYKEGGYLPTSFNGDKTNITNLSCLYCERNGNISASSTSDTNKYNTDINVTGSYTWFVHLVAKSMFNLITGQTGIQKFINNGVKAQRYRIIGGSMSSTMQGEEYFPGDTAGYVEESSYSVYR